MSGETLYTIACEMLNRTNVFQKETTEIKYTYMQEEISLLSCLKKETSKHGNKFCQRSESNLQLAYDCIVFAMIFYLEDYPATFSFKQQTRDLFKIWAKRIKVEYSIKKDDKNDDALKGLNQASSEKDTGVAMLKVLHSRKGVTYKDIAKKLGIGLRSIQKSLVKISPSLYDGPKVAYPPFRLGGQPLYANITLIEKEENENKRFITKNTVHPLVLQENLPQLATLLKALAHQFWDYEDDKTRIIGIDIWSQMSVYARNKIVDFYAFNDKDLASFVNIISEPCPDDHACLFYTEKEMMKNLEMELPLNDAISHLMKAEGRKGVIILKSEEQIEVCQVEPGISNDGEKYYRVVDANGDVKKIKIDEIRNVKL